MNRIFFNSYKKAFPALECIIKNFNIPFYVAFKPRTPKNVNFLEVFDINSLREKIVLEDWCSIHSDSSQIHREELWAVLQGKPLRIRNKK